MEEKKTAGRTVTPRTQRSAGSVPVMPHTVKNNMSRTVNASSGNRNVNRSSSDISHARQPIRYKTASDDNKAAVHGVSQSKAVSRPERQESTKTGRDYKYSGNIQLQEKRQVPVQYEKQNVPVHNVSNSIKSRAPLPAVKNEKTALKRFNQFLINDDAIMPGDIIRVKGGIDRPMLVIIILLVCFGSVMVFSSSYAYALSKFHDSYYFVRQQIGWVLAGAFVLCVIAMLDYRIVRRFSNLYFVFICALLVAVLLIGVSQGQAKRWLYLGFTSIQPSEFMKLALVLVLANYYQKHEKQTFDKRFWRSSYYGTFVPFAIVGVVCVLIAMEHHISGTIIMFCIGILVIFASGSRKSWFLFAGIGFIAIVTVVIFATSYATKRLDIWLHPENYSVQSEVWQTLQGLYAIGSGGLLGVGLGNSRQKHLFVSQPQNDFIFSIICEELGYVGALLVIALFIAFIWRGYKIALRAPDTFSRLVVIGIVGKVGIQAFLNIAVVTGSIPNTGITLPFISYGGSSLTTLLAEMGIVLSISRYSYQQK